MLLNHNYSKIRIRSLVILILYLYSSTLLSQIRDWEQLYPNIDRPVTDIKYSNMPGIPEYGLLFALPGEGGGLAYFTEPDSLSIFAPFYLDNGISSIVPDTSNNRIFCSVNDLTPNSGLCSFDLNTQSFETILWFHYSTCLNKLTSGFYFGHFYGLYHSQNGDEWNEIDYFDDLEITDIDENCNGTVFISTRDSIYIENNGVYNSFETPIDIYDIYIRNYPNDNEVYIACGQVNNDGAVYRVEYENYEITGLTYIGGFYLPICISEYDNYLVIGCSNYFSNIFLVEPVENGEVIEIGSELGINRAFCFEFYPIYTENFIVGSDIGIFLATNLTSIDENMIETDSCILLNNHPNPFNPTTTIEFSIKNNSEIELSIYNIKGQKLKTLAQNYFTEGSHSIVWNGDDESNKPVSSGVYLYKLNVNGKTESVSKCLLLK